MRSADSGSRLPPESNPISDPAVQTAIFALTGESWTLEYAGVSFSLRNTLGLSYLQRLVQHPGEEVHALDLLMGPGAHAVQEGKDPNKDALINSEEFIPSRPGDLGPMLDPQAKQNYRRRINELNEELDDLRERGAHEQAEKVESELEFIKYELAKSVGLGGRDRHAGSAAERARINVTRAIRTAIQRVSEQNKLLGKLFDESIRTGSFCRYMPNPKVQINWRFGSDAAWASVAAAPPAPPPQVVYPAEPAVQQGFQEQTAFVGRAAERAALRGYLQRVMKGEGNCILICGPAGIGKTRLSRE